jgi:hypothetical protein
MGPVAFNVVRSLQTLIIAYHKLRLLLAKRQQVNPNPNPNSNPQQNNPNPTPTQANPNPKLTLTLTAGAIVDKPVPRTLNLGGQRYFEANFPAWRRCFVARFWLASCRDRCTRDHQWLRPPTAREPANAVCSSCCGGEQHSS